MKESLLWANKTKKQKLSKIGSQTLSLKLKFYFVTFVKVKITRTVSYSLSVFVCLQVTRSKSITGSVYYCKFNWISVNFDKKYNTAFMSPVSCVPLKTVNCPSFKCHFLKHSQIKTQTKSTLSTKYRQQNYWAPTGPA